MYLFIVSSEAKESIRSPAARVTGTWELWVLGTELCEGEFSSL